MTLQDKLDAMRDDFENGRFPLVPTRAQLQTMQRATQALIDSGQAENALRAGDRAPEFMLQDANGDSVSSRALLARGALVATFYRGVWCPYCNYDLQALEEVRAEVEVRGASLAALSPQTLANSRKSQRDTKLGFPILSDPGAAVAAEFGLRFALPNDLIEVYRQFGNDLPKINDDPAWVLPMPARYVIGMDGMIAYAEVNPDYTQRPDPAELLPVLNGLRARTQA
ncbi:alkyl hydroperoxide reductase/ Thiol specific antioxidant/ Mal allergen [Ancylobacter novellus DSM 506]|uniref:thioredoxin-dependent peroxiredoxin n=1 Tax=Ancylobacter novellus (strain ATCC 8093 / DSM 506 / JCM 20403 / CCM 1077 / IAM 12100 / NBRC 12443 / NCIMB 10456) TaxID=639283 RepID=D7A2S5_ANCN5|nr:peroxiredoxin-like family protein [Ancylobacter novellus]ADH91605.1 alkyl hydroperoxide reductase/ Thiol specific antioxidant/ Mal allergen [Ancylobacter novellus DSM 506]